MKTLPLFKILFGSLLILLTVQNAYADCPVGSPSVCTGSDIDGYTGTGGADDIIIPAGASISNNGQASVISTLNGGDIITLNGGSVTSDVGDAIRAGNGPDTIIINSGSITAQNEGIEGGGGADTIVINSGVITGQNNGIRGGGGTDTITINGGAITGTTNRAILGGNGNDTITLNGGMITGNTLAINANGGDDIVNIGGNAIVNGTIRGGNGNDTLRFSMAVPEVAIPGLQAAILAANPNGDTIAINGLTYTWDRFETLEANFTAITLVPTLSEWSMFLLISLLGFVGLRYTKNSKDFFRKNRR